ncbi:hypothetical protein BDB00DRAFT_454444 [Zychaea mexicana]|uniref:uncharacterized protein n=1 Tax=Zychaea mexicana TaxID=64656 RepID=UPI0022FEE377|nr:uncharacterized protein BDB00DRAFT_454444 [Zychaea mexicana]KAI9492155.1 hypothetical protein BDB00DRAFT_454444 [Zychaea mexicana]
MQKRATPDTGNTPAIVGPLAKRRAYHPWMEPFELGKKAFAEAKYKEAVGHFSNAINLNDSSNITLIDCRAAAHEKDGNLTKGLEDALTMIKASPTHSKGYLRAGKLFSLQERLPKAVAVYDRALKTVAKTDPRYTQLTEMKKAVQKQLKKQKQQRIDFVKVLPFDIIEHIFELLSFERRIQCMAVSRSWRTLLKGWSGMWREIDFSSSKLSAHAMKQYMSYVNGRYMRKFTMAGNRNRSNKMLQLLIDRDCHYVECLRFIECDLQLDLLLRTLRLMGRHLRFLQLTDTGIPLSTLSEVLEICPTISRIVYQDETPSDLQIKKALALTHIELSFTSSRSIDFATLKNLLVHCPHLTHLALYPPYGDAVFSLAWQSCPQLTSFRYQQHHAGWDDMAASATAAPKKRGISELGFPTFCEISDDTVASAIQTNHNTLEILDIRGCARLTSQITERLSAVGAPQLRELYIENSAAFTEASLCAVLQSCTALQVVHLQSVASVTNTVLKALSGATMLRKVNISNCPKVTGTGLRQLVDNVDGLQLLMLNNCNAISQDAVSYARDKLGRHGVECRYSTYR